MKSLVVYDSKSGSTEDCALEICKSIHGDIQFLKDNPKLKLENYNLIIIGTPLYMGMPMGTIKRFCKTNLDVLLKKDIAFFICGMDNPIEMIASFKKSMPVKLIERAKIISHFGGELRIEKAGFFSKIIMKKMLEDKNLKVGLNRREINSFIKSIGELK